MLNNNMKNIVVLKNLPSNLVDEAIVILKTKKYAKKLQLAEKKSNKINMQEKNNEDYVIKEAESVIASYISKIENGKKIKKSNNNIAEKYKKLKRYSIFVSGILLLCIIKAIFG